MNNFFHFVLCILCFLMLNTISAQYIKIDHVVGVYHNLDSIHEKLAQKGFMVKPGKHHKNGLLNSHVKLANGTYLELMTLVEDPKESVAKNYADLLNEKEGGVYLCLVSYNSNRVMEILRENNIVFNYFDGASWNYITFPENSGLQHLFIIEYKNKFLEDSAFKSHNNQMVKIDCVVIEGNSEVHDFFQLLDLNFDEGDYSTETGKIKVMQSSKDIRPRVLSLRFSDSLNTETIEFIF